MICTRERYARVPELFSLFYDSQEAALSHKYVDTIVADGDGTVYGPPVYGSSIVRLPQLNESPTYAPIIGWIRSGQVEDSFTRLFILITGNELQRTKQRFVKHIPKDARRAVVYVANGGAVLYYHDIKGKRYEDLNYRMNALAGGTTFPAELAEKVIETGLSFINKFYKQFSEDERLRGEVQQKDPAKYATILSKSQEHPHPFVREELITQDASQLPRIEVRTLDDVAITQITLYGVPYFYDTENADLQALKDVHAARVNFSIEINLKGVDKQLALKYLGINPHRSLALGDRPKENDKPLTTYSVMPFISVSREESMVPQDLMPLHIGKNMQGSATLIQALLDEDLTPGTKDSVIQTRLHTIVKQIQCAAAGVLK